MQISFLNNRQLKCAVVLLLVIALAAAVIGPTIAYIVTGTTSLINTFVSGLTQEGDLIIRKTVEHPFGDGYVIPDELAFRFRVELGEEYSGKTVRTTQGEQTADDTGSLILAVKPGGAVGIRNLAAGTKVTVTELEPGVGFEVKGGEASQTVTIRAMEEATVAFVNCYTPDRATAENVTITGIKTLLGRDWQEGDAFTFQLDWRYMDHGNSEWVSLGTRTVEYDAQSADFNRFDMTELLEQIEFDRAGIYAFRVAEIAGIIGGITYDDAVSYFDIAVSDADMDGMLEISEVKGTSNAAVTKTEGNYQIAVEFTNRYAPAGSAEVRIPITKILTDRSGQGKTPAGFIFELYDEQGGLVGRSEATSAAGETYIKLVYDASFAGQTFCYTLKEVDDGQTGVQYDGTSYEVTVTVTDELDGTVSVKADLDNARFENVYDPQDANAQISGEKKLVGRELNEGEFAFDLYRVGADFVIGQNDRPIRQAVNDEHGSFCFDTLTFEQVGQYYYAVRENTSAGLGGVTYDETIYLVTISVTDHDGVLSAQCKVTDSRGEASQICFQNTYEARPVDVQLEGVKKLQGAELEAEMFSFNLFAADESYKAQGEAIQTASNDAEGIFRFEEIRYDSVGVYRYAVCEDTTDPRSGITYDERVYGVTVTVSDDGNGKLTAQVSSYIIGGDETEQILFENVYTAQDDPSDPDSPPTGDRNDIGLYIIVAAVSAAMLTLLLAVKPRKNRM